MASLTVHILLLRHYPPVEGHSMIAFAELIAKGLEGRGHQVEQCTAPVLLRRLVDRRNGLGKWLGYIDQFLIFPLLLRLRLRRLPRNTLIVLADLALGPWMGAVGKRPHLVHCHDLLALEGSLGRLPEHRLSFTGRLYQRWIRHGFRKACCFMPTADASRIVLHRHLIKRPLYSSVLLNPVPPRFRPYAFGTDQVQLPQAFFRLRTGSYLLHIGKNWYKNRLGVLAIWERLRVRQPDLTLVLVGELEPELQAWLDIRPHLHAGLHVIENASNELIVGLYNGAAALLFPSRYEGFGWPILEAMACGCAVFTTKREPMTQVGGLVAHYLPPAPQHCDVLDWEKWVDGAADQIHTVLQQPAEVRQLLKQQGLAWAQRFSQETWLDQLETHYQRVLAMQAGA